jgi:UDP-N-acetylmuramoyl-tripeptide--D-alanyl-D-alanine ligase
VGRLASGFLDILITVGPRAKFIAETARKNGMRKGSVQSFDSFEHVQGPIVDMIRKGDLVLVKASRGMHLERVVEALRVEAPQSAQKQAAIV